MAPLDGQNCSYQPETAARSPQVLNTSMIRDNTPPSSNSTLHPKDRHCVSTLDKYDCASFHPNPTTTTGDSNATDDQSLTQTPSTGVISPVKVSLLVEDITLQSVSQGRRVDSVMNDDTEDDTQLDHDSSDAARQSHSWTNFLRDVFPTEQVTEFLSAFPDDTDLSTKDEVDSIHGGRSDCVSSQDQSNTENTLRYFAFAVLELWRNSGRQEPSTEPSKLPLVNRFLRKFSGKKEFHKKIHREKTPHTEIRKRDGVLMCLKVLTKCITGPSRSFGDNIEELFDEWIQHATPEETQNMMAIIKPCYALLTILARHPDMSCDPDRNSTLLENYGTHLVVAQHFFGVIPSKTDLADRAYVPTVSGGSIRKDRLGLVVRQTHDNVTVHFLYRHGNDFGGNVPEGQKRLFIRVVHENELTNEEYENWPCDKLVVSNDWKANDTSYISLIPEDVPLNSPLAPAYGNVRLSWRSHSVFQEHARLVSATRQMATSQFLGETEEDRRSVQQQIAHHFERIASKDDRALMLRYSYELSRLGPDVNEDFRRKIENETDQLRRQRQHRLAEIHAQEAALTREKIRLQHESEQLLRDGESKIRHEQAQFTIKRREGNGGDDMRSEYVQRESTKQRSRKNLGRGQRVREDILRHTRSSDSIDNDDAVQDRSRAQKVGIRKSRPGNNSAHSNSRQHLMKAKQNVYLQKLDQDLDDYLGQRRQGGSIGTREVDHKTGVTSQVAKKLGLT